MNLVDIKLSHEDVKAFNHYVDHTHDEWLSKAFDGMVNKAVKTILRDYLEEYRQSQTEGMPTDMNVIMNGIVALKSFKPYNNETPPLPKIRRKNTPEINVNTAFQFEDYVKIALENYYSDYKGMIKWFMVNKIHRRRTEFAKLFTTKLLKDKTLAKIPAHQDDLINHVCSQKGYKNAAQLMVENKNKLNQLETKNA